LCFAAEVFTSVECPSHTYIVLPFEGYPERQLENNGNTTGTQATGTQDTSNSNSVTSSSNTTNTNADTKPPDKPAKRRFTEKVSCLFPPEFHNY